jgi:tetratricopeptide (TPR) repeat protein
MPLLVADVDGDGVAEIVVGEAKQDATDVVVLKALDVGQVANLPAASRRITTGTGPLKANSEAEQLPKGPVPFALKEIYRLPLPSTVHPESVAAGDADNDGRPELVIAAGYYGRQSYVLKWESGGKVTRTPICPDLPELSSHAEGAAIGDVDGDGLDEIVLTTTAWSAYELRVCKYDVATRGYPVVWQQPLGALRCVRTPDLDGDGKQEIVFSKHDTDNSVAFGPSKRHGYIADGVHGFRCANNEYVPFLQLPVDKGTRGNARGGNDVSSLSTGDYDRDGRPDLAAVFARNVSEGNRLHWANVYRNLGGNRFARLTLPIKSTIAPRLAFGDIDGDGKADLVLLASGEIRLYGIDAANGAAPSPLPPPPEPAACWALQAAHDLLAVRRFADAEKQYAAALPALDDDDHRRAALRGVADCREARQDTEGLIRALEALAAESPEDAPESRLRQAEALIALGRWKQAASVAAAIQADQLPNVGRSPTASNATVGRSLTASSASPAERDNLAPALRYRRVKAVLDDLCAAPEVLLATSFGGDGDFPALAQSPLRDKAVAAAKSSYLQFQVSNQEPDRFWIPVAWQGESFLLEFDMMPAEVAWAHAVRFGLISWADEGAAPDGVWYGFGCAGGGNTVGGGGDYQYRAGPAAGRRGKHEASSDARTPWKKRTWYRVRLLYVRPLGEVRCEVTQRETGVKFFETRLRLDDDDWPPQAYGLGVVCTPRQTQPRHGEGRIANLRFVRYGPSRPAAPPLALPAARRAALEAHGQFVLGRYAAAEKRYAEAVPLNPDDPNLAAMRAAARAKCGDVRGAFAALVQLDDVEPGALPAVRGSARIMDRGQVEKMLQEMQREAAAQTADAQTADAQTAVVRALAHLYLNQPAEARAILDALPAEEQKRAAVLYHRGHAAVHCSREQEAKQLFAAAIAADPAFPFTYRKRAMVYADQQNFEAAVADYRKYLSLRPQDARQWYYYAECLAELALQSRSSAARLEAARACGTAYRLSDDPDVQKAAQRLLTRLTRTAGAAKPADEGG